MLDFHLNKINNDDDLISILISAMHELKAHNNFWRFPISR